MVIAQPEFCCVYGAGGHAHVVIDVLRSQGIGVQAIFEDYPAKRHPGHQGVRPGIRLAGPVAGARGRIGASNRNKNGLRSAEDDLEPG